MQLARDRRRVRHEGERPRRVALEVAGEHEARRGRVDEDRRAVLDELGGARRDRFLLRKRLLEALRPIGRDAERSGARAGKAGASVDALDEAVAAEALEVAVDGDLARRRTRAQARRSTRLLRAGSARACSLCAGRREARPFPSGRGGCRGQHEVPLCDEVRELRVVHLGVDELEGDVRPKRCSERVQERGVGFRKPEVAALDVREREAERRRERRGRAPAPR